jgi:hypothetical protein
LHDAPVPVVQLDIVGHSPLQYDVAVLGLAWYFSGGGVLAAFAVLDDIDARVESVALMESSAADSVDLD